MMPVAPQPEPILPPEVEPEISTEVPEPAPLSAEMIDAILQGVLDDLPSENVLVVELLETIPPERAKDWFVAAPFHRGVELGLWEVREKDPGVHKALSIGPVPQSSPSDAPPVP